MRDLRYLSEALESVLETLHQAAETVGEVLERTADQKESIQIATGGKMRESKMRDLRYLSEALESVSEALHQAAEAVGEALERSADQKESIRQSGDYCACCEHDNHGCSHCNKWHSCACHSGYCCKHAEEHYSDGVAGESPQPPYPPYPPFPPYPPVPPYPPYIVIASGLGSSVAAPAIYGVPNTAQAPMPSTAGALQVTPQQIPLTYGVPNTAQAPMPSATGALQATPHQTPAAPGLGTRAGANIAQSFPDLSSMANLDALLDLGEQTAEMVRQMVPTDIS